MTELRGQFHDRGVYFFSYDWRLSSEDNAKELKNFIDKLGAPKVDLVCHSMGGLVASSYYKSNINSHKINRIITLATPYEGAPKILYIVQNKLGSILAKPGLDQLFTILGTIPKQVKAAMRGAAELSPSVNYIAGVPMRQYPWPFNFGSPRNISYDEYYRLLLDIFGGGNAQLAGWFQKSLHGDGDYNALFDFPQSYFAVGIGQETIIAVNFNRGGSGIPLKEKDGLVTDRLGDGTVPYLSATMMGKMESLPSERFQRYDSDHTAIVKNADAIAWVVRTIRQGEPTTAAAQPAVSQVSGGGGNNTNTISWGIVTGDNVNCRENPNLSARVITQFNTGDRLEVLNRVHDAGSQYAWYRVRLPQGGEGWIFGQFFNVGF